MISPWDRWIDPYLATGTESTEEEIKQLRDELRAKRDAALELFGTTEFFAVVANDLPTVQ